MAKKKKRAKEPDIKQSLQMVVGRAIRGPEVEDAEDAQDIQTRGSKLVSMTQSDKSNGSEREHLLLKKYQDELSKVPAWDKNMQKMWSDLIAKQQKSMGLVTDVYDQFVDNIGEISTEFAQRSMR